MKVLLAEEDATVRRTLADALSRWGHEVVTASTGEEALAALEFRDAPRLALLARALSGMDGAAVCRKLRREHPEPYVYVILLGSGDRGEDAAEGWEAEADDYVRKPVDEHELKARLRTGERLLALERRWHAPVREAPVAGEVALAGWDRAAIVETLQRELVRANREDRPVAAVKLAVDHQDRIVGSGGPGALEVVIRETAARARGVLRLYDGIGRYGPEELLIVLPGCDAVDAFNIAQRVRGAVAGAAVAMPDGAFSVTASLGVAAVSKGQAIDAEALVRLSDRALSRARDAGGNRVELLTADDRGMKN